MQQVVKKISETEIKLDEILSKSNFSPEKISQLKENWGNINNSISVDASVAKLHQILRNIKVAQEFCAEDEDLQAYWWLLENLAREIHTELEQRKLVAGNTIMRVYSGYKLRKNTLAAEKQSNCQTMVVGNDPVLAGLEAHSINSDYALVATGGLRSLWIISKLSLKYIKIPQLYIIDNSSKVIEFWRTFKTLIAETKTRHDLLEILCDPHKKFAGMIDQFSHPESFPAEYGGYHNWNIAVFVGSFIKDEQDFKFFKQVVDRAQIISQSWGATDTMLSIKRICKSAGREIIAYPSNIYEYAEVLSSVEARQILEAIELLDPKLCIHTATSFEWHQQKEELSPDRVFFITNNLADQAAREIRAVKMSAEPKRMFEGFRKRALEQELAKVPAVSRPIKYKPQVKDPSVSEAPLLPKEERIYDEFDAQLEAEFLNSIRKQRLKKRRCKSTSAP